MMLMPSSALNHQPYSFSRQRMCLKAQMSRLRSPDVGPLLISQTIKRARKFRAFSHVGREKCPVESAKQINTSAAAGLESTPRDTHLQQRLDLRIRQSLPAHFARRLQPCSELDAKSAELGRAHSSSRNLDHLPRLVEKYKQAVLAAAFRGELTHTWREGSEHSAAQTLSKVRSDRKSAEFVATAARCTFEFAQTPTATSRIADKWRPLGGRAFYPIKSSLQ